MIINVSKAIFMIMYAVWVRARKNGPRLGNKRLSIRVPSFEKEKVEKLAKNTQKAVFITILWTHSGSNCPNLSVKLGLPFTFSFSQDLSEKLPYYTLAGRKREKKPFDVHWPLICVWFPYWAFLEVPIFPGPLYWKLFRGTVPNQCRAVYLSVN